MCDGGRVRVDGVDVRDVTQASLRAQMGIVPQDSFLFAGTVADNIRYGQLNATRCRSRGRRARRQRP